jgi:cobalamin synthase
MNAQRRHGVAALRFAPLWGGVIGAAAGGVYWLASQIWPASVAVVLAMLATILLSGGKNAARTDADAGPVGLVFAILVKYNALMALSAASLPFAAPANLALGLIMIAGLACSRALAVTVAPASHADLAIALASGFAPAALIGLPGLVGLVAAIGARIAYIAYAKRRGSAGAAAELHMTQQLSEVCFYLGALAAWSYV